jgi:hypothetical protein
MPILMFSIIQTYPPALPRYAHSAKLFYPNHFYIHQKYELLAV